jgi:hypothetical protein
MKLTRDSQTTLDRRVDIGMKCLCAAQGSGVIPDESDRETLAADAISDILTALYGPAGYYLPREVTTDEEVMAQARALVNRAVRSFMRDNEDYIVEVAS